MTLTRLGAAVALALLLGGAGPAPANMTTLDFEAVASLDAYAPLGVTFSANASIWATSAPTVLVTPDGGAYSGTHALQFGSAGGVLGSVFFASDVSFVSLWALSGPGPDNLNPGMYIRAFDSGGNPLAEDVPDPSVQFDLVSVAAPGIRRLDVYSPVPNNDVWDDLIFSTRLAGDTAPYDDVIDLTDLNNVLNNFGSANPAGFAWPKTAGTVDLNDLNDVLNHFGFHAGAAQATIPEPLTPSAILCTLILPLLARRRR